jgi:ribosomal protein S3AE
MELKLKIRKGAEGLVAEPVSLQVVGSYIRKMIRGGTDYVEDSFVAECKDTKVLVKPFMITRKKVSRAIRNDLRHTAKVHLENHFKVRTSGEIFTELLMNKIQKDLSLRLKKVYPLALCEIRIFEIVNEKK